MRHALTARYPLRIPFGYPSDALRMPFGPVGWCLAIAHDCPQASQQRNSSALRGALGTTRPTYPRRR